MAILCRGIRGATSVDSDSRSSVLLATGELLLVIARLNDIDPTSIASIFFTTTPDLVSEYPALAARKLGWLDVPLLCGHEMNVPNGLPRCVRVLVHWNTEKDQSEIQHVYLGRTSVLRPDRQELSDIPDVVLPPEFADL